MIGSFHERGRKEWKVEICVLFSSHRFSRARAHSTITGCRCRENNKISMTVKQLDFLPI